ncbi:MAG: GNAT family protein [Patescibacteria group bacterium]|nr:GNAT family protein [Patescibacteria group bacterium]
MSKKIILKGRRVILRPLSLKDAPRFCQWLTDPEVTTFLAHYYEQGAPSLKEERAWIKKDNHDNKKISFSIDTILGRHIGSTSLFHIDNFSKKAEFGIMIGDKEFWGQGYGTEATKLLVDYGFRKLGLHKIYLGHIAYNIRGHKCYKKIGFKKEGEVRDHIYRNGHWHNEIYMGLLRDEYIKKLK